MTARVGRTASHPLWSSSASPTVRPGDSVRRVDLALYRGRIHGILGENGAGKSTLMKMLIGLVLPTPGRYVCAASRRRSWIPPTRRASASPWCTALQSRRALDGLGKCRARRHRGGSTPVAHGDASARSASSTARDRPDDRISDLTAGMRQRVEIIKCLRRDPEILVFDEPTSVLSLLNRNSSSRRYDGWSTMKAKRWRWSATSIAEVISASDEITIMRDGKVVESRPTAGSDRQRWRERWWVETWCCCGREHAAFGAVDEASQHTTPTHLSAENSGRVVLRVTGASAKVATGACSSTD